MKYRNINELLDDLAVYLMKRLDPNKVVFKGNYVIRKWLGQSRLTHDIDLSITDYRYFKECLFAVQNFAVTLEGQGIYDDYDIRDIDDTGLYYLIKFLKNGNTVFGVDIGYTKGFYGCELFLRNGTDDFYSFSVERVLADKLSASWTNARYRRIKDFYDIYRLSKVFSLYSNVVLNNIDAIGVDERYYNYPSTATAFNRLKSLYNDPKLIQFSDDDIVKDFPTFEEMMKVYDKFAYPLYNKEYNKVWYCENMYWEDDEEGNNEVYCKYTN